MNNAPRAERVSTLELFFDLVLVVMITQLTAVIRAEPTVLVGLHVVLLLAVIFGVGAQRVPVVGLLRRR